MPSLRALCISSHSRSKCRFMRLISSCTCSPLTVWPSSTTTAKNVAVGNDRHAALGHRLEVAVGGEIGMNDPIDAGLGGGAGRAGATRMNADAQVAPVRLAHHGCNLVFRQH